MENAENFRLQPYTPQIYYDPFNISGDRGFNITPEGVSADFSNFYNIQTTPAVPEPTSEDVFKPEEIIDVNPYYPQPRQNTTPTPAPAQTPASPDIPARQVSAPANTSNLPLLTGEVDLSAAFTSGNFRVTSGYSITPTALRNGRGHRAIDRAVPSGTNLSVPNTGTQWTITKTGEKSGSAGKYITLATRLNNGDNLSVTLAHLSSINVNAGDILNAGQNLGKTGNTGNSTGPHLHVSVKLNGQTVNPLRVNLNSSGEFNPDIQVNTGVPRRQSTSDIDISQDIAPQPLVQPIVSSDAETQKTLMDIFFGGNNLFSGDIFNTIPYGGY